MKVLEVYRNESAKEADIETALAGGIRESVLVTDRRELAARVMERGGCVIGVAEGIDLGELDFPEADVIVTDREALTESLIRRTYCHHFGLPFTVAQTARLVIRESAGEDYETIYRLLLQAQGALADGFAMEEIDTKEKFLRYVKSCYNFFGFGVWTVQLCAAAKQEVIGWCGLYPKKDPGEDGYHVELGFLIDPARQRQGYGYEACREILRYAREEVGLEQIRLKTDRRNLPARRLAEKMGFSLMEGKALQENVVVYTCRL